MIGTHVNELLTNVSTKGADGTRPSGTEGAAVTPGASNTYGSYASLGVLSSTLDVLGLEIVVHTVGVAGTNRMVMADFALDPAGGTSFTVPFIPDLLCGAPAGLQASSDARWFFPRIIPAGASLGVRGSSLDANTTAFRVLANAACQPTRPEVLRYGSFCQAFGIGASGVVAGVAVTPGTTVEGAWAELGTADKTLFYLEFGISIDSAVVNQALIDVDIAVGDATTKRVVISNSQVVTLTTENVFKRIAGRFARIFPGDKIYARAQTSGTANANTTIAAYGVG